MARERRPRRVRSLSESLLSIALGLEAVLVFFVALTAFGLQSLPAPVALGGGVAAIIVIAIVAALQRYPWAVWLGWIIQVLLIATGFLLPIMFLIGAGFAGIWIYCFVKSRQLEGNA